MKLLLAFFLVIASGLGYVIHSGIFAAKTDDTSPLTQIAQEGIQPEGMPIVLKEGETRPENKHKTTTYWKPVYAPPLGATQTATTVAPEAPKLPQETIVVPVTVNVPPQQSAPAQTSIITQPVTPITMPLEATISVSDANHIKVLTNKEIQADQTTFTGGISLTYSMKFQDNTPRHWKNTDQPAYLYELSTSNIEKTVPFSVTITTGTESLTREIQL